MEPENIRLEFLGIIIVIKLRNFYIVKKTNVMETNDLNTLIIDLILDING